MTTSPEKNWKFIKDNLFTLITIITGAGAIILSQLNRIKPSDVTVAVLAIVTLLATTELVDKTRRLDRIENTMQKQYSYIRHAIGGVEVLSFTNATTAFQFMSQRILEAQSSIDHAALAPSVPRWHGEHQKYENAITKILKSNQVRYRYIADLPEKSRLDRIRKQLSDPSVRQFFVRYFSVKPHSLQFHNFMIFDEKLAIINYPYTEGDPEKFLAIENPEIVAFYVNLFSSLWNSAEVFRLDKIKEWLWLCNSLYVELKQTKAL
jgi:hypothetical protein